ncbi:MAG: phosphoribosylaminoimidazolesuccinocarboxamide synthase [Firmicutes bacterium]|nr:phosphoribosylaminoimidazolesuccinocarboxamide synthase [Bacillota bacterium]
MEFIKVGKTKDVYRLPDGNILLKFKDAVTGHAATGESDPGGNQVIGEKAGVGSAALKMTTYYFELFKKLGIKTHYVSSNLAANEMTVKAVQLFGNGLEFVVRYEAAGSFVRRFGGYIAEGAKLDAVYEITLKDDARDDPPATPGIIEALGLATAAQLAEIEALVKKVCGIVRDDLAARGLELIDIKVEAGLVNGEVALIDEVSAGNMRVYKDRKKLGYIELSDLIG